jgi:hypothetical protein
MPPGYSTSQSGSVHGKREISEADRILSADELEARVCAYYGCSREAHLVMPEKIAWVRTRTCLDDRFSLTYTSHYGR